MPKITHFARSRLVDIDKVPSKLRLKMLRNQIFFVIEPSGDGVVVTDAFDDLDTGIHKHSKGLFHLHTHMENQDGEYKDETRYLQVWMNFEHFDDMETVQRNFLVPYKLAL